MRIIPLEERPFTVFDLKDTYRKYLPKPVLTMSTQEMNKFKENIVHDIVKDRRKAYQVVCDWLVMNGRYNPIIVQLLNNAVNDIVDEFMQLDYEIDKLQDEIVMITKKLEKYGNENNTKSISK